MGRIPAEIEKQMKTIIRDFLKDLANTEKKMLIDIAIRNERKNAFCTIAQKLTPLETIYFLFAKENAIWKNIAEQENYYWRPNPNIETIDLLFVDDPKEKNISKVYYEIQTSAEKYQYVFLLTEKTSTNIAKQYQKALVKKYHADSGASFLFHWRRIPGFLNQKYSPPFMIQWKKHGNILSRSEIEIETPTKKIMSPKIEFPLGLKKAKKTWQDFADEDKSRADFRYALYLLHFYPPQTVAEILRRESPELDMRKGKYVEDYIQRTVAKAQEFFELHR